MSALYRNLKDRSGFAPDWVWLAAAACRSERLRRFVVRWLRMRFSPDILLRIPRSDMGSEERARAFSFVQEFLSGGDTYKETGFQRTELADAEVVALCENLASPVVMEVGASDGSSSVALLEALGDHASVHLTDRHPFYFRRGMPGLRLFLDTDGCLMSMKILGCLYLFVGPGRRFRERGLCISTENPLLKEIGARLDHEPFDITRDVRHSPVDVVKCANLLHLEYFSPAGVSAALSNLGRSLREDGHLVVSQNNAKYEGGEAVSVFQRRSNRLVLIRHVNSPDILTCLEEGAEVAVD